MRGDVPGVQHGFWLTELFSPRARGCSLCTQVETVPSRVFPACAGMFRAPWPHRSKRFGFPRVRGDVPVTIEHLTAHELFSPRARGCSSPMRAPAPSPWVFPACAGMFRGLLRAGGMMKSFPRVRGDVPRKCFAEPVTHPFSPRARGCSLAAAVSGELELVFPACAGMFRKNYGNRMDYPCFPRVRGDVPTGHIVFYVVMVFSPRARGCSRGHQSLDGFDLVFPAYAGMFRNASSCLGRTSCFPRVRGDVPLYREGLSHGQTFSPRARGCSQHSRFLFSRLLVFPACAGMFLSSVTPTPVVSGFPRIRGDVPGCSTMRSVV